MYRQKLSEVKELMKSILLKREQNNGLQFYEESL